MSDADFLHLVFESIPHPFYVVNASDYTISLANSAACPGGLSPRITCHALSHARDTPCDGASHPCPLEIVRRTRRPTVVEHEHASPAGPRVVEVHAFPILDEHGAVVQMIEYALDITERRRMEREREGLVRELQDALARVKRLSGLLPICAVCKKVRDDAGYWQQIEAYIRDHSEADFSHSFCPECATRLYPEGE